MCNSNKIQCPKCGGSGKVEHSHVCEGVCFMCGGFGEVFPQRVDKLTKRAEKRKATIEAKRLVIQEEIKAKEEKYWDNVYNEITNRNIEYFNNYKCSNSDGCNDLFEKIEKLSMALSFNHKTSEQEFRNMLSDYFDSSVILFFRLEISKYTLEHYNFHFVSLDGRDNDLTNSMHEVQSIIK